MADKPICRVPLCGKPAIIKSTQLCSAHYQRERRYGDPLGGGPPKGFATKWLDEVAIPYRGKDCLIFPFYKAPSGHGKLSGRTGTSFAHVYVAERVIGPKPSPAHETCHDCGTPGCVNGGHLYWGTRAENMADRKRHGCFVPPPIKRGKNNFNTKLSEDQVVAIRARVKTGATLQAVAQEFGMSISAIHAIKMRRTWAYLP